MISGWQPPFPVLPCRGGLAGIVGAADVADDLRAVPGAGDQLAEQVLRLAGSGKPAVVNLDGWVRRLVEENDAGAWVPAGDSEALAWALSALAVRRVEPHGLERARPGRA